MASKGCPGCAQPCAPAPHGCGRCPGRAETSGILNIDKPAGLSSHDVVARVRRLTRQQRVGHAGTLDPMATGVLLVCLGQATRVSEYLMDGRKLYRARIHFGAETDTYDATGQVTRQVSAIPTRAEIEALLPRFTGEILQTPPAYSALKIEGEPAYRKARRGETVEQAARPVTIYSLELRAWEPPDLELDIWCGRGTYIRSLAYDLGRAAGSAAHLTALERRAVGQFVIEGATPLDEFAELAVAGEWQSLVYPLDEALLQYPEIIASAEDVARLLHGQTISAAPVVDGELRRVYDPAGEFIALAVGDAAAGVWRPHKVFAACA
jgi:tRNA pseudouridine55 synthase